MTAKITKPKCLLLDANIVIESHKLGIWGTLTDKFHLILPSSVVREEALFYFDSNGTQHSISLMEQVENGTIVQVEALATEVFSLLDLFQPYFLDVLHGGETEALALIRVGKLQGDIAFCTSDASAIRALAMLHRPWIGISFENILTSIGLTKSLDIQYTERFFQNNIRKGQMNLITGEGLKCSLDDLK